MGSQYVAYYASRRVHLMWGVLSIISLALFIIPFSLQTRHHFSMMIFLGMLAWIPVSGFIVYVFMKSLLSPLIQVYPGEVIIYRLSRKEIPLKDIISFKVSPKRVEISYTDGGQIKSEAHQVAKTDASDLEIKDGKFSN